ncbi:unnamed protein product [Darwinula stevensoni]|uniref:Uncharacterized protein n=1 Tax=Darwinula stevensoni TaxID=69355 RepID=A0A7R9A9E0_9CRUS|nr:unnamed protein product [Darwinula stevensoni]CAG0897305.1 unnamed protein product [Darwinula stevensoni]
MSLNVSRRISSKSSRLELALSTAETWQVIRKKENLLRFSFFEEDFGFPGSFGFPDFRKKAIATNQLKNRFMHLSQLEFHKRQDEGATERGDPPVHDPELGLRIGRVDLDDLRLPILHSGERLTPLLARAKVKGGAGYVNLLFFLPARMSNFLSYLKTNCFTSTYFDSTAGTTGNKIIACSTTNLADSHRLMLLRKDEGEPVIFSLQALHSHFKQCTLSLQARRGTG